MATNVADLLNTIGQEALARAGAPTHKIQNLVVPRNTGHRTASDVAAAIASARIAGARRATPIPAQPMPAGSEILTAAAQIANGEPRAGLQTAWQLLGQIPSGFLQNTIANSALPDDAPGTVGTIGAGTPYAYRPAIIDTPGAMYGIIHNLISGPTAQDDPEHVAVRQTDYGDRALQHVDAAATRVQNTLGVHAPENVGQMAMFGAGGMILPETAPLEVTAATRLGRAVQTARNAAIELALPLRQTSLPRAMATGAVFASGLGEGVDALHDNPEYSSITEATNSAQPAQVEVDPFTAPAAQLAGNAQAVDPFTAPASALSAAPVVQNEVDPFTARAADLGQPDAVTATSQDHAEDEQGWFTWRNAAIAVGGLLAGRVLYRYGRDAVRNGQARLAEQALDPTPLRGIDVRRSRSRGPIRQAVANKVQQVFQQDLPIRNMAEDFLGRDYARNLGYDLDRITNTATGAKVMDLFRTGRAPGVGNARYQRIAPILDSYGKELAPAEQQAVDDAILAARGLDDREALEAAPSFTSLTDDQLRAIRSRATTDPKLNKYFEFAMRVARDQRDFMVKRGLLTQEVADRWARARPHWTPFNRSVLHDADMNELLGRQFTANKNQVSSASATGDAESVQAGATGNPFVGLLDRWANLVRMAEMNDVRARFLNDLNALGTNPQTSKPWVRRLPARSSAFDDLNTHIVFENGQRVAYHVSDPSVSSALHFTPRATLAGFETARQIMQNVTTGPLGTLATGFAIFKSPFYDATLGMLNRKPGMRLGTLNEIMLGLSRGHVGLGALDPTAVLGGPIGAVRYAWDEMKGQIGSTLEREMFRQNSWLRGILGDKATGQLGHLFSQAYEDSTKSLMDQLGISSHTMHGSPDPTASITHIQDVAPHFATAAAQQVYDSVRASGPGALERVLAGSKNWYARGRAAPISRAYAAVLDAMHNGFAYQALATAKKQRNFDNMMGQRAAEIRRLSADASQHGGSQGINKATSAFMYSNLSLQAIYELGKMVRHHPGSFAINLGAMTATLMGLHYLAIATDPEAQQQHLDKSPEQRAASVTTFGGAEIPIDPLARLFMAPQMALFDHLSGVWGDSPNVDMLTAMHNTLDGDEGENLRHDEWQQFVANLRANNPFDINANPVTAVAFANAGIDPGMTRFSGQATPPRTQQISGADQDSAQTDALASAYWQNVINSLGGTFGSTMYNISNDVHRSLVGGSSADDAMARGRERWFDTVQRGAGVFRPLFGQYEHVISVGDNNWQQYNERRDGVDRALRVYNRDVRTSNTTSMSNPMPLPTDVPLPQFQGTRAATIGFYALMLDRETANMRSQLGALGAQSEAIRNRYVTPREQSNVDLNVLTRRRREMALWLLIQTRHTEQVIGQQIGDPDFTFENYDPRAYAQPISSRTAQPD